MGSLPSHFLLLVVRLGAVSDPWTSGLGEHQSTYGLGPVGWGMERGQRWW